MPGLVSSIAPRTANVTVAYTTVAMMLVNSYAVGGYASNANSSRFSTSGNESKSIDRRRRRRTRSLSLSLPFRRTSARARASIPLFGRPHTVTYSTLRVRVFAPITSGNTASSCDVLSRTHIRVHCTRCAHTSAHGGFVVRRLCVSLRAARNTDVRKRAKASSRRFTSFRKTRERYARALSRTHTHFGHSVPTLFLYPVP